jgi:hypothetical protein
MRGGPASLSISAAEDEDANDTGGGREPAWGVFNQSGRWLSIES